MSQNNLHSWTQNPLIVVPFSLICVTLVVVIADSDRAASFAGAFMSGMAAVIAVVLSNQMQRSNERARHLRERAASVLADARELHLFISDAQKDAQSAIEWLSDRELMADPQLAMGWNRRVEQVSEDVPVHLSAAAVRMSDDIASGMLGCRKTGRFARGILQGMKKGPTPLENEMPLLLLALGEHEVALLILLAALIKYRNALNDDISR